MTEVKVTYSKILCCLCGTSIEPNAAAMCIDCLRAQYDITTEIEKDLEIIQCKTCNKWLVKLDYWTDHELESTGLMNVCLKKILGLQNKSIKLVDTAWVWTEPHSKRLKISLDLEKAVLDDKIKLRQRVIVEFIIKSRQCPICTKEATDHNWGALIQIRQNTNNKRTLLNLENLLIKSNFTDVIINTELKKDGIDLYFHLKNQADKCCEFISSNLPTKCKYSKKLVSHNNHNHTATLEHTLYIEIPPLLKDDLIILPKEYYGFYDIMIIYKISSNIHLINPFTLNKLDIAPSKYFNLPFNAIFTSKQLINFIVLDIELVNNNKIINGISLEQSKDDTKTVGVLAEAVVVRESDLGDNDNSFRVLTHLGHLLQPGDLVVGYDLRHSVANEDVLESLNFAYPDVVLVKKSSIDNGNKKSKKKKARKNNKIVSSEVIKESSNIDYDTKTDSFIDIYDEDIVDDFDDDNIDNINSLENEIVYPPLPPDSSDI